MFFTDTIPDFVVDTQRLEPAYQATFGTGETGYIPFFDFAEKVDVSEFRQASVFENHLLQPFGSELKVMPDVFNAWFFAILFLGFVLYAWLLSFNLKRVGQIVGALWGNRGFGRMSREGDVFSEPLFFPFVVLILLCFSLGIFRLGVLFDIWDMEGKETMAIYGQVLLSVALLYLTKVVIVKNLAWIFREQQAARHYLLNVFVFNISLTLLFLPLLLVVFFGDSWLQQSMIYGMLILFVGWFIWRAFRSFSVTVLQTKFSYIHNFLYFCTLEIGYYLLVYVILKTIIEL